jgi:hypothetical protein
MSLLDRRAEAEARLAEERRKRGAAMLDGGPVEGVEAIEDEIRAIDDALTEEVRRQRVVAADAEETRAGGIRAELAAAERERLDAVARAEAAAGILVSALRDALAACVRENDLMKALGGQRQLPLEIGVFEGRLADLLSLTLNTIVPGRLDWRFGHIKMRPPFGEASDGWRAAEEAHGAAALAAFTKGS